MPGKRNVFWLKLKKNKLLNGKLRLNIIIFALCAEKRQNNVVTA